MRLAFQKCEVTWYKYEFQRPKKGPEVGVSQLLSQDLGKGTYHPHVMFSGNEDNVNILVYHDL